MSGLEFVASLVRSLAWPGAAAVGVFILRGPLSTALSGPLAELKIGPFKVKWKRKIVAAADNVLDSPEFAAVRAEYARLQGGGDFRAKGRSSPDWASNISYYSSYMLSNYDDELARTAEIAPWAAIIDAFGRIEGRLRMLLGDDAAVEKAGGLRLAQLAFDGGLISKPILDAIKIAADLRNVAVHRRAEVDTKQAADFLDLAGLVLFAMPSEPSR